MMSRTQLPLSHLTRLEPREAWLNEATDFTPWLARPENFGILAETLHFADAEVESIEYAVGSFSADIIAKDRDGLILIENQLEQTDHTHLGQILTYLAGLSAPAKIIWISTKVREEHRAAIDWLNSNTPEEYSFFAVELEVYRIGESPAAPYFHVAARPNEWTRHRRARNRDLAESPQNERQKRYVTYWAAISDYLAERDPSFFGHTPSKDYWWSFGIGRTNFSLNLLAAMRDKWIGVELFMNKDQEKLIFDHFYNDQSVIEAQFGSQLEWDRLDGQKGSKIGIRMRGVDPNDSNRWPEFADWYFNQMQRLRLCFTQRIKDLDLNVLGENL